MQRWRHSGASFAAKADAVRRVRCVLRETVKPTACRLITDCKRATPRSAMVIEPTQDCRGEHWGAGLLPRDGPFRLTHQHGRTAVGTTWSGISALALAKE